MRGAAYAAASVAVMVAARYWNFDGDSFPPLWIFAGLLFGRAINEWRR